MIRDSVYEWQTIAGGHPLHAHVNHVQLQETHDDWYVAGDWMDVYLETVNDRIIIVDVLQLNEGLVRYHTEEYLGYVVMHCNKGAYRLEAYLLVRSLANSRSNTNQYLVSKHEMF